MNLSNQTHDINQEAQETLQEFYLTMRKMSKAGFPRRGIQRSFEEMIYSFMGKNAWKPTHITRDALKEYVTGINTKIQRAHGAYKDRMDRFDRTLCILEGEEMCFEDWWKFFTYHDKTVLMTRKEHGSGEKPTSVNLIKIPADRGLFESSGFTARIRKTVELSWMKEQIEKYSIS